MENLQALEAFYTEESPEGLRLAKTSAQRLEFEVAEDTLRCFLPPACTLLDSCAGTGVYAFHLAGLGHRVTAGDFVACNVAAMEAENQKQPRLMGISQMDARNLSRFADESFDAVLCMGALYHLHEEADRAKVLAECRRVLRPGGLLFASYMNRFAVIQNNARGALENLDEIMQYLHSGIEGVFYASTPEAFTGFMEAGGFAQRRHLSMDGIANFLYATTGLIDEDGLNRWKSYHKATCEVPSLLGAGYHNLFVGQKTDAGPMGKHP